MIASFRFASSAWSPIKEDELMEKDEVLDDDDDAIFANHEVSIVKPFGIPEQEG